MPFYSSPCTFVIRLSMQIMYFAFASIYIIMNIQHMKGILLTFRWRCVLTVKLLIIIPGLSNVFKKLFTLRPRCIIKHILSSKYLLCLAIFTSTTGSVFNYMFFCIDRAWYANNKWNLRVFLKYNRHCAQKINIFLSYKSNVLFIQEQTPICQLGWTAVILNMFLCFQI